MITVAICTWNRAALLRATLEQMTRLRPPHAQWELLAVDNGSTDDTASVLADFASSLPLRVVEERQPGLSNARNAAVAAASGDFIVWTDDDVLVDAGWLSAYEGAFARHPFAAFFGGPVRPWFEGTPPAWLVAALPNVGAAFALRDFDAGEEPLGGSFIPFGANMAFRTSAIRQRAFDPALGRVRAALLGGEETAVIANLLRSGETGWWVPDAFVQHYVPTGRQNIAYLRRYYAGNGSVSMRDPAARSARMLFGRPRWAWRAAIEFELRYRIHRLSGHPTQWIEDLKRASKAWGVLTSSTPE